MHGHKLIPEKADGKYIDLIKKRLTRVPVRATKMKPLNISGFFIGIPALNALVEKRQRKQVNRLQWVLY